MKSAIVLAAIGLTTLGFASSANAFKFSPPNTKFSGTGPTSATKGGVTLSCTGTLKGSTNAKGIGKVTGGSFTGALGCSSVGLTGLPWPMKATSATTGTVSKVTFTSPIGNCGPGTLPVHLSGGVISFNFLLNPGACQITGSLTTHPTISIVP